MKRLFQLMAEKKASDIFISVGSPINIKINGTAMPINQQLMEPESIIGLLYEVLTDRQKKEFEDTLELNTAFAMPPTGSFRISAFRQKNTPAVVVRYIPGDVPNIDTLAVPEVLKEIVMEKRGLVLMVGATGSGKSTTLAAMLDLRNGAKSGHILTLEDPVEFLFTNKKCIVNQREVGTDTLDFKVALKNALRQAPDCILIGEIRDKDTMAAGIAYAQSGHLCLATLHANNSYHALNRIISFYPLENRPALLQDLSAAMKAIISQRLIKNLKGGRSAAVEVLLNTRYTAELIEKGEINEIKEAMEKSMTPGSVTFEQALYNMYTKGLISKEEALGNADSATNLMWLMNQSEGDGGAARAASAGQKPAEAAPDMEKTGSFADFKIIADEAAQ
ncbi:MAG: PilT/PilU family type 4a pilus ATPase [Burkholderiales bacterium]|nr:PilT/PilU family type 4a pilus ATPase [Burkholderiales bacterium]